MNELSAIASTLTSLKAAADLAIALKGSATSLKDAEIKFKVAELLSNLADAKSSLADTKIEISDLKEEIDRLNRKLNEQEEMVFKKPFYFREGDDQPFCPTCWEKDQKSIHLSGEHSWSTGNGYCCEVCENTIYTTRRSSVR